MSIFSNKKAFSLVELSIVLTIIALLSAAVISGKKLLHNSKINKLITEINSNLSALKTFKLTHNYWPGDYNKAQDIWGSGAVDNGDGDGYIEWSTEVLNVTTQLALESLIKDKAYSRTTSNYALKNDSFDNLNTIFISSTSGADGFTYMPVRSNVIQIGSGTSAYDAFFTPKDAYLIDSKLDDGKPRSGKIYYRVFGTTTNASCTNSTTSYYLSSNLPGCNIIYEYSN